MNEYLVLFIFITFQKSFPLEYLDWARGKYQRFERKFVIVNRLIKWFLAFIVFVGICLEWFLPHSDENNTKYTFFIVMTAFWLIIYLFLMIFNLHFGTNLLIAMRRHQYFENKRHKNQIMAQLTLATITLAQIIYFQFYGLFYQSCSITK
jgi:hypothetical protein